MLPNAQDLKNFIEVATVKNVTRAAQRLGMTQPALSQSMQKLERTLGVTLLIRGKNGVDLTRAGKKVQDRSRELLGLWEEVRNEALDEEIEIQGQFTIGCHPSVAQYALPEFLPTVLADQTKLRFRLVHDLSRKVVDQVVEREVDVGIAVNPIQHPDLVILPLMTDSFSLWHSSKKRGSETLICDTALSQVQSLITKFAKQGLKFSQIIHSDNLEVIRSLGIAGAGYVLLPDRVAASGKKEGLQKVNTQFPEFTDKVCLVYRADTLKSAAGKYLIGEIKKSLR
jgi:DNA-binding transcriptional LysR family regulator